MKLPRRCVHEGGESGARNTGAKIAAARTLLAPLSVAILVALPACAETPRTATNFCRVLADRIDEIVEPPSDNAAVERLVEHYTRLAEVAPLAIEDDFITLRDLFVAASKVRADDEASVQAVADLAYKAELAAEEAGVYAAATCGLDLSTGLSVDVPSGGE
jgi:hypothetical protein